MKRIISVIFLLGILTLFQSASAGLIFDNGTGEKNDTLVIQFCLPDSQRLDYAVWDTAYVKQCYGGVAFKEVALTNSSAYRVGSVWPGTVMFEWRARASDSAGDVGAYTWWVMATKKYGSKPVRYISNGSYYVTPDINGNGSEACTLLVKQSGSAAIQNARIVIRSLDQTTTRVPRLLTDTNGKGIAELDPSSYFISITANNYAPLCDTIIVHRDSTWQISMTLFDPGNPPSPELCRVYGWVYDIGGENLAGITVSAEIPSDYQPVKFGDVVITPFKKSVTSDSTGYWQIDLFPNSVLSKSDSKYQFTIEYPSGVIMKSKVVVPDTVSWQYR